MILQAIENPDKSQQYKRALHHVFSGESPHLPGYKLPESYRMGWLCLSIWRLGIYRTGDDRLKSGGSMICRDLNNWNDSLPKIQSESDEKIPVQMISVPLVESTVAYKETLFAQDKFVDKFKHIEIAVRIFERFEQSVDVVSVDLSATHVLWVYHDGVPKYTGIHQGDDGGVSAMVSDLQNTLSSPQPEYRLLVT